MTFTEVKLLAVSIVLAANPTLSVEEAVATIERIDSRLND